MSGLYTIDFSKNPVQEDDYSDITQFIPNFLEARELPGRLQRAREQDQAKTELAKITAYLKSKFGERESEANVGKTELGNEYQGILNRQAPEKHLADLNLSRAQAAHHQHSASNMGLSNRQKELMQIFGGDTEEYKKQLARSNGIFDRGGVDLTHLPAEALGRPLEDMPKQEQNEVSRSMHKDLAASQNMTDTLSILDKLESLNRNNPDLWKSFALILSNDDPKGISEYINRNWVLNEKEKTAVDKFKKLSGDLIVKGGEALGGRQRITDAMLSLLSDIKPDVANTPEANQFVIDNIREIMSEGPAWHKALQTGIAERIEVIRNPEIFRKMYQPSKGALKPGRAQEGFVRGTKNGKTHTIPVSEAEDYVASGGVLNE